MMKLYFSNGSPFARKVRVVLAEKGLAYEADLFDGGLRAPAGDIGPTLSVPMLRDGDLQLWESDLIVDYLLRTYPDTKAKPDMAAEPPLAPWMARPQSHWQDMKILATIASMATSIVNLRLMQPDGVTPETSPYMARQKTRVERCLDWLESEATSEGFAPGWFSIMDLAFTCPVLFGEARGVMPWRGRPKLEALVARAEARPSLQATPINAKKA
jgi:glutathione S-transferase